MLDSEAERNLLSLQPDFNNYPNLRIDAEPHWRTDPQTICLAVGSACRLIAKPKIPHLLESIAASIVDYTYRSVTASHLSSGI